MRPNATLWWNLRSNDVVAERIRLSESEDFWCQYALNEEGITNMVEFRGLRNLPLLPVLTPSFSMSRDIERGYSMIGPAPIIVTSHKDAELKGQKVIIAQVVATITRDNPVLKLWLWTCMETCSVSMNKAPEGTFIMRLSIYLGISGSSLTALNHAGHLWWLVLGKHR